MLTTSPSTVLRQVMTTGSTYGVLLRSRFATDAQGLWRMCTEPEPLSRWLGPVTGDLKPGGVVRLALGGGEFVATCTVLRCEAPHTLDLTWQEDDSRRSVVRASITEVGADESELAIEHLAVVEDDLGFGWGWEEFMTDLAEQLRGPSERGHDCEALDAQLAQRWKALSPTPDARWGSLADGRFTVVRRLSSAPPVVWEAVAGTEGLRPWFGHAEGDLRPGGQWRVAFDGGGVSGTVQECLPGVSFTTTFTQDSDDAAVSTHLVRVELTLDGDGTLLTLTHSFADLFSAGLVQGMAAGWHAHLLGLQDHLQARPGRHDWATEFTVARIVHESQALSVGDA